MPVKLNSTGGGSVTLDVGSTASNFTQTLPSATTTIVGTDTTQTLTNKTIGSGYGGGVITQGTAVASTSGTSIDFTGIPSWAKRITVMFSGVSLSGSDDIVMQLGDAGGFETTGYIGGVSTGGIAVYNSTFFSLCLGDTPATTNYSGSVNISNLTGNNWVSSGILAPNASLGVSYSGGSKTLSDVLTQVRITRDGTNTFDAGTINIQYEG
jgi:hypothetical protein